MNFNKYTQYGVTREEFEEDQALSKALGLREGPSYFTAGGSGESFDLVERPVINQKNPQIPKIMRDKLNLMKMMLETNHKIDFQPTLRKIKEMNNPNKQMVELLECVQFAVLAHGDQKRKNPLGEPYISHPLEVGMILLREGFDLEVVKAGILHDVVEDTQVPKEKIGEVFGGRVLKMVMEATDDKSKGKQERKDEQVRKAPLISPEGQAVKLADKESNLRGLKSGLIPEGWTLERVQEYFRWGKEVSDGLAPGCPEIYERISEMVKGDFPYLDGKRYPCIKH